MLWKHGRFRVEEFQSKRISRSADDELTREVTFTVPPLAGEGAIRRGVRPCAAKDIRGGLTEKLSRRGGRKLMIRTIYKILRGRRFGCLRRFRCHLSARDSAAEQIRGPTRCRIPLRIDRYILNRVWTFPSEIPTSRASTCTFLASRRSGLVINNATIYLLHNRFRLEFSGETRYF